MVTPTHFPYRKLQKARWVSHLWGFRENRDNCETGYVAMQNPNVSSGTGMVTIPQATAYIRHMGLLHIAKCKTFDLTMTDFSESILNQFRAWTGFMYQSTISDSVYLSYYCFSSAEDKNRWEHFISTPANGWNEEFKFFNILRSQSELSNVFELDRGYSATRNYGAVKLTDAAELWCAENLNGKIGVHGHATGANQLRVHLNFADIRDATLFKVFWL